MSQAVPKVAVASPPTPVGEPGVAAPRIALLVAAFAGTVGVIWGFETRACGGVVSGAIAAMMRASFLALTHPPELVLLALIVALHLAVGYLAVRRRPFRGRVELLPMVFSLASFLLGLSLGGTGWFASTCALHPWR